MPRLRADLHGRRWQVHHPPEGRPGLGYLLRFRQVRLATTAAGAAVPHRPRPLSPERYGARVSFAQVYADPAPHEHFAVIHLLEHAFAAATGGGIAGFRSTLGDPQAEGAWFLDLANGGVHELVCVGGAANGGGGPLGNSPEEIVTGPAPEPVAIPEVAVNGAGRIATVDVEAWVAAVVTNAAPVTDGQSWLKAVERASLRVASASPHRYGVFARTYAGGGTFIYWKHVAERGRQARGEAYTGVADAI